MIILQHKRLISVNKKSVHLESRYGSDDNSNPRANYSGRPAFRANKTGQEPRPRFWTPTSAPSFTSPQLQAQQSFSAGHRMPNVRAQTQQCPKCGRSPHQNFNQSPAINKFCALCDRRVHFIAVCNVAQRTRQMQQFSV